MHTRRILSIALSLVVLIAGRAGVAVAAADDANHTIFDITKYGAVSDGKTSSADAFKSAIDACKQAGGGVVRVPAGKFLTAPIDFVDGMTLQVDEGATLLISDDMNLFPVVGTRWEGVMVDARRPCVWAKGCKNVAITGGGTIDGQGAAWWKAVRERRRTEGNPTGSAAATLMATPQDPAALQKRPPLVQFRDCTNVKVEGVTLTNSPFWTSHFLFCDNVTIKNVKMLNPSDSPNTDAVDVDSSTHVTIDGCYADVGDDAFTLKSGKDEDGRKVNRPTEDIVVSNCIVKHAHGAVVIGSETAGSVRRVRFSNIVADGTDSGVRIKSMRGRGGVVEDVRADNISMNNVANTFIITMRYRASDPEPLSERTPLFKDIHLSNISATNSRRAGGIYGIEERPIGDVTFENMNISAKEGFTVEDAKNLSFKNVIVTSEWPEAMKKTRAEQIKIENWVEAKSGK
jgi:polygalacturonase